MRAVYYYNLVEQLGGVTLQMSPVEDVDLHPGKDTPLDIYEKCIIPDLEFAVQWLPIEERTTRPSKKSAMGMLARACLQSIEYDSSKSMRNGLWKLPKRWWKIARQEEPLWECICMII